MLETLSRWIVGSFFREVVVEGRERIPESKAVIFAPNHPNSLLDPLLIQLFSDTRRIRFVAKAPLFKIPVFGQILRGVGAIPVVRRFEAGGEVDYAEFFGSCVQTLEAGSSIVIFPEGRSLPQPFLAPLKTGPARLFFMAREKGIEVSVIPVGLNYECGMIFRSSVQISVATPVRTAPFEEQYNSDPKEAVLNLTSEIGRLLGEHVFQAETYRDRELMLLLERLSAQEGSPDSWPERLARLKGFEVALAKLHEKNPSEIENLRRLLARYQRLSATFGYDPAGASPPVSRSFRMLFVNTIGMILAMIGVVLNWLPYRLVGLLVARKDESEAATFKVVYGLFLFPAFYVAEGWWLAHFAGLPAAMAFALLIAPLSTFTLRFFEWREEIAGGTKNASLWFGANAARRIQESLSRLRSRILSEADSLAAQL